MEAADTKAEPGTSGVRDIVSRRNYRTGMSPSVEFSLTTDGFRGP